MRISYCTNDLYLCVNLFIRIFMKDLEILKLDRLKLRKLFFFVLFLFWYSVMHLMLMWRESRMFCYIRSYLKLRKIRRSGRFIISASWRYYFFAFCFSSKCLRFKKNTTRFSTFLLYSWHGYQNRAKWKYHLLFQLLVHMFSGRNLDYWP